MKRLFLSETDKKIAGICGGLAEYFEVDATLIRLGFVFLTLVTALFPMLFAYLISWVIIPNKNSIEGQTGP